jgi:parallel beta-helix repeat protein
VIRKHVVTGEKVEISDVSTIYYIHFKDFINVDNISKILTGFEFVEFAEGPELIISTSSYEPNDNYLNNQWGIEVADLAKSWGIMRNGQRIGIAVSDRANYANLDTVTYHDDLQPLTNGGNFIDTTLTENMIAPDNHGTMVSGVFGATTDNDIGIAGVAHNTAKVYSYYRGKTALRGILNDIDNYNLDIRIINCSWHGYNHGDYANVIKDAMQLGIIVVAGAGNDSTNVNNKLPRTVYPAGYDFRDIGLDRVIGVSATVINTQTKDEEFYSEYNFSVDDIISNPENAHIDITAPGRNIFTTNLANQYYSYHGGTSLSSPFVAGVISLILSVNENLTASEVYDIITKTTDHVSVPDTATFYPHPNDDREWNRFTGFGRVNAYKALVHTIENYGATLGGFNEVVTLHDDIYINQGSVVTIKAGTILNMKGDIIVENGGELHIEHGVTVNASSGTRIQTNPGGTLTAGTYYAPVVMQGVGNSTWQGVSLNSSNNVLSHVHIKDVHYYGALRVFGDNNSITNCVIKNNLIGLVINDVTSIEVINNQIINNTHEGLVIINTNDDPSNAQVTIADNTISSNGKSGVYLFGSFISDFTGNVIEDNGENGIFLSAFSDLYFNFNGSGYNRIKNNENHQFWLTSVSDAQIGGQLSHGNNTIYHDNQSSSNKYIYRMALTGAGYGFSPYSIFAQQTYWGEYAAQTGGPSGTWFVGNINYSNHLTSDPTGGSGATTTSGPLAGGGGQLQTLLSADMVASITTTSNEHDMDPQQPLGLAHRAMQLRDQLSNKPADRDNARRINELYAIKMFDPSNVSRVHNTIQATFDEWSEDNEQRYSGYEGEQAEWVQLAREAAMIRKVRLAMLKQDMAQAQLLTGQYAESVLNKDHRLALKHALVSIAMHDGLYEAARDVLKEISALEPDKEVSGWYSVPDNRALFDYLVFAESEYESQGGSLQLAKANNRLIKVDEQRGYLPDNFALKGNYPNPFNPVTVIPFTLPMQADVLIEVFDISGRRVARLTDRQYEAGHHQVSFDAGSLASGVYLIRAVMRSVEGGDHQFTRKMALVK